MKEARVSFQLMPYMSEEQAQDALDGAALRRLREAFPALSLRLNTHNDGVIVEMVDEYGRYIGPPVCEATIAEAADKCREALG